MGQIDGAALKGLLARSHLVYIPHGKNRWCCLDEVMGVTRSDPIQCIYHFGWTDDAALMRLQVTSHLVYIPHAIDRWRCLSEV